MRRGLELDVLPEPIVSAHVAFSRILHIMAKRVNQEDDATTVPPSVFQSHAGTPKISPILTKNAPR